MSYSVTLGLEEEVFVLEHGRLTPTLQSLDYMRRLLWSNPRRYTVRSASNFARGQDQKECFMGSVEVSTGVHCDADSAVRDLLERRKEFAHAARGAMVVPVGSLFTLDSPSNTSGLHVHVGVPREERDRVYGNLAYFLPVLAVASASSPYRAGKHYGLSYRIAEPHALGPLREDREYRFQDLIITKRLGTVEVRVLDPMPELSRMAEVVRAVESIARWPERLPFNREEYNGARPEWSQEGLNSWVRRRWEELQPISPFPLDLLEETFSERLAWIAKSKGVLQAYEEADRVWRVGTGVAHPVKRHSRVRVVSGLAGFYAIRLPYMAYKGIREWKGSAR
jgi:gamma-glutamyl:cysteine ligase YbdK (ATP-grasp superfamily)